MDNAAATLLGKAPSGVIDEPVPHFRGHQSEKSLAIFRRSRSFAEKAQIGFVQEGGGLEDMASALAPEMGLGDPTQFAVRLCDDFLTGCGVPGSPRFEEF